MLKEVRVNTKALESMLFIWVSLADREKIADEFFIRLAESPEMEAAYREGFDQNGFRKVLSALANREILSDATAEEKRFWNNNMWMTEDLDFTRMMLDPVKTLNLDSLKKEVPDYPGETLEVIFYPGTTEFWEKRGDKLFINFFKVSVDIYDEDAPATIDGREIPVFIRDVLYEA